LEGDKAGVLKFVTEDLPKGTASLDVLPITMA
jgi:hypothetical protein